MWWTYISLHVWCVCVVYVSCVYMSMRVKWANVYKILCVRYVFNVLGVKYADSHIYNSLYEILHKHRTIGEEAQKKREKIVRDSSKIDVQFTCTTCFSISAAVYFNRLMFLDPQRAVAENYRPKTDRIFYYFSQHPRAPINLALSMWLYSKGFTIQYARRNDSDREKF